MKAYKYAQNVKMNINDL